MGLKKAGLPNPKKEKWILLLVEFRGEANLTSSLEVLLKRDERVMRFLTVALDKHALAYASQRREKLNAKSKEEK